MSKKIDVPEQDATYLHANHQIQSVPEMAKELKRANVTVYKFMEALGLPPMARVITRDHPFRRANRHLEKNLLLNRIQNSKLKRGR